MQARINNHFWKKYGLKDLISSFLNYQLFFDEKILLHSTIDRSVLKKECIEMIKREEGIAYVVDIESATAVNVPENISHRIIQGYHYGRSGALQIVLKPAWFQLSHDKTGSIHGSWNPYDTHIPLMFMGSGIKKGKLEKQVSITDIASTISALLNIQMPNGATGKVIVEIINGRSSK